MQTRARYVETLQFADVLDIAVSHDEPPVAVDDPSLSATA